VSALRRAISGVALAVALAACGEGGRTTAASTTPEPPPPMEGCDGKVWLRVRGVNPGAVTAFRLDVASVTVTADGAPLESLLPFTRSVDLLADGAFDVAVVRPPAGTLELEARVELLGGAGAMADGAGVAFGSCPAPLVFRAQISKVDADRCHAVVHVDVARSIGEQLEAGGSVWTFAPSFSMHY
jgi:hypothetical protein